MKKRDKNKELKNVLYILSCFLIFVTIEAVFSNSGQGTNIDKRNNPYTMTVNTGNGLTGHYYQNYFIDSTGTIRFTGLTESFSRVDTVIDFWNGSSSYRWQPVPGWGDRYSVHWTGYIFIEQPGDYGFGTISDDGSQIFIDSLMIVNNGERQWYDWEDNISEGDTSGTPFPPLSLDSGFHAISVRFFENASYDGIELWWFYADGDTSDIPYYGTNFHGSAPTYNPQTNWEIVPTNVLFTEIDTMTSIDRDEKKDYMPAASELKQNYPNPFNPSTTIEFTLPKSEFAELKIYNILGKEISTLVSNKLNRGNHTFTFDGSNLASGIYYYSITTGDPSAGSGQRFHQVCKMILLK